MLSVLKSHKTCIFNNENSYFAPFHPLSFSQCGVIYRDSRELKGVHLCNDRFSSGFSGITCERITKVFFLMLTIFCSSMIQYST